MSTKECRILIVDDDGDILDLVQIHLEKNGFHNLDFARNGEEAFERIASKTPDILVCDWNMPKLSGLEVLKKLRSEPLFYSISFLMLTAERQKNEVEKAIKEGVNDYLIKPFNQKQLVDKITKMAEKRFLGPLGK
jgi:two-component system, chemotaxis family, chemotaxis protein CheY